MTWVSGVYFLMDYFRNDLFFGESLSLIYHFTQTCKILPLVERIINLDVVLQFVFSWMCLVGFILECFQGAQMEEGPLK